jgi:hypothetical protein
VDRDWDGWLKRAEVILAKQASGTYQDASEAFQFATSLLAALYGSESPQSRALRSSAESVPQAMTGFVGPEMKLSLLARGAIENAKRAAEAWLRLSLCLYLRPRKRKYHHMAYRTKNLAAVGVLRLGSAGELWQTQESPHRRHESCDRLISLLRATLQP